MVRGPGGEKSVALGGIPRLPTRGKHGAPKIEKLPSFRELILHSLRTVGIPTLLVRDSGDLETPEFIGLVKSVDFPALFGVQQARYFALQVRVFSDGFG
jgi:hypothetical protein